MDDPVKTAEGYTKFLDDIDVDFMFLPGINRHVKSLQHLGINNYFLSEDDCCIVHNQTKIDFMKTEEYPKLISNPRKFLTETLVKRNTPAFNLPMKEAYAKLKQAVMDFRVFAEANRLINDDIFNKRKILPVTSRDSPRYDNPYKFIFDTYRGIQNALADLRRCPDLVRQAIDAIWKQDPSNRVYDPEKYTKPYPFGMTGYHPECFLSPYWFDELFFNLFKDTFLPIMEAGTKFFLKGEGHFLNTVDRYRQLPKGSMIIALDDDDPFEAHKKIGDWQTLATGIRTDLLKMGTKQQCVDYVKKCFDTFAPGGGFVFFLNKPLIAAGDAKPENLIAVYETANRLAGKHH
jgi:hypothetical protein